MSKMENIRVLIFTNDEGKRVLNLSGQALSTVPKVGTIITKVGEIHVLDLSNNHLTELPTSINKLKTLEVLKLDNNQLSELPETIGELINLTELSVKNNQLSELPETIGGLINLTKLSVKNNQLSELPETIGELINLTNLSVGNNQLSVLPPNIKNLKKLQRLHLANNQLMSLPDDIGELVELGWLNVSNNQLSVLPASVTHLKKLQWLHLEYNQLMSLPDDIGELVELEWLHVRNNQLSVLPASVTHLKKLQWLHLENNQLMSLPDDIGELVELEWLHVRNNQLSVLPASFTHLKKLQELYLTNNQLMSLPDDIGELVELEMLDVSNNQLSVLPASVTHLKKLQWLYLENIQLMSLPDDIGELVLLESLDVDYNLLSDLPESLTHLKKLQWLELANNQLTSLPDGIGDQEVMERLDMLDVRGNPLTVEEVRRLVKLQEKMKYSLSLYVLSAHVRRQSAEGQRAQLAYELALRDGYVNVYRARILLIGQDRAGKTSLKKSLLGLPFDPKEQSTEGIEVDPSNCEIDVKQVRNWNSTIANKPGLVECSKDIARMVAEKLVCDIELFAGFEATTSKEERFDEASKVKSVEELSEENYDSEKVDFDEDENVSHMKQVEENVDHLDKSDISSPTRKAKEATKQESNGERLPDCRSENTPDEPYEMINATSPPDDITKNVHQLLKYARGKRVKSGIAKDESVVSIDMWDFAGQHLYYASHPVFLSSRAVYVLVHNLSKRLNAPAQPSVRQGTHDVKLVNPNDETNMENLLSWLATIHSVKPTNEETDDSAQTKLPYLRPPVFIVGTHADKPVENIAVVTKQIKESISGKEYERHVVLPFFSIDNTARSLRSRFKKALRLLDPRGREHQAEQEGNTDGIQALQDKIMEVLRQEPYMGEEIPVRWFLFEKVIEALVAKQIYHRNLQQLQNYAKKECFMEDAKDFATMISFYHGLGMIIRHRNTVVLKAQWLIDLFKRLITIPRKVDPIHAKYWRELERNGILSMEHVDRVFSDFIQQGIIKEDILDMMERFGLIAKFSPSPADVKYFVPAQLKSSPESICKMKPSPIDPCPLYLHFVHGFVPHGLFPLLVSRSIRWCCETWSIDEHPTLYQNGAWFVIGKQIHDFVLICKTRFIKIVLRQREKSEELATLVREFVEGTLQDLSQELPYLSGLQYEFCVACPYCHQETEEVGQACSNHDKISCTHEECFHLLEIKQDQRLICKKKPYDKVLTVPGLEKWLKRTSQLASDECGGHLSSEDAVKEGTASDYELEKLSNSIAKSWMNLGRCLKITQAKLDGIDTRWPDLDEKAHRMLLRWKQKNGSNATYRVLSDALCHEFVNRKDLAEDICFH